MRGPAARSRPSRGTRPACRRPPARAPGTKPEPDRSERSTAVERHAAASTSSRHPAVALVLELGDELGATLLDDAALEHHVHEVGLHQVQDALVVGDDQDAHIRARELVDALGDDAQRIDVQARVGLVEHRDPRPEHRQLEHLHSLLLTAGEAVVEVSAGELARDVDQLHRLLRLAAEVLEADLGLAACLAVGVEGHPQVLGHGHAGNRDGVLEGEEEPGARALFGRGLGDVLALEDDLAVGRSVTGHHAGSSRARSSTAPLSLSNCAKRPSRRRPWAAQNSRDATRIRRASSAKLCSVGGRAAPARTRSRSTRRWVTCSRTWSRPT